MKKVLIAFDGTNSPSGAFEFARQMHRVSPILLVGIFLPQVNLASVWSYANAMSGPAMIPLIEEEQAVQIQKNIKGFEKKCKNHHIACRVHKDYFGSCWLLKLRGSSLVSGQKERSPKSHELVTKLLTQKSTSEAKLLRGVSTLGN